MLYPRRVVGRADVLRRVAWLAVPLGLALAQGALGQSLGDAARREKERRAKVAKTAAHSYTDADLPSHGRTEPGAEASASPSPSPSPAASASPAEDESVARRRNEQEWRRRFAAARARLQAAEAAAWRTVVEVVYVNGIPMQQRARKFVETDDLIAARKALEDLEEEFRRTGLPPGWSRE
jgi:hypothetical protein